MIDFNSEDDLKRLLKSACKPESPPAELQGQLLERLDVETSDTALGVSRSLWERPRIWLPVIIAVIAGLVGYGAWLSLNVVPMLVP